MSSPYGDTIATAQKVNERIFQKPIHVKAKYALMSTRYGDRRPRSMSFAALMECRSSPMVPHAAVTPLHILCECPDLNVRSIPLVFTLCSAVVSRCRCILETTACGVRAYH